MSKTTEFLSMKILLLKNLAEYRKQISMLIVEIQWDKLF